MWALPLNGSPGGGEGQKAISENGNVFGMDSARNAVQAELWFCKQISGLSSTAKLGKGWADLWFSPPPPLDDGDYRSTPQWC